MLAATARLAIKSVIERLYSRPPHLALAMPSRVRCVYVLPKADFMKPCASCATFVYGAPVTQNCAATQHCRFVAQAAPWNEAQAKWRLKKNCCIGVTRPTLKNCANPTIFFFYFGLSISIFDGDCHRKPPEVIRKKTSCAMWTTTAPSKIPDLRTLFFRGPSRQCNNFSWHCARFREIGCCVSCGDAIDGTYCTLYIQPRPQLHFGGDGQNTGV